MGKYYLNIYGFICENINYSKHHLAKLQFEYFLWKPSYLGLISQLSSHPKLNRNYTIKYVILTTYSSINHILQTVGNIKQY